MNTPKEMTEDEQQTWVREQYQIATKYLAEKGIVTDSVQVEDSRYLVPLLALWKITAIGGQKYWVLCGDLPSDYSSINSANNAREALKYFSLKWQVQAENLLKVDDPEQKEYAQLLIGRADGLYKLQSDESMW
jgi:hypothetical protein